MGESHSKRQVFCFPFAGGSAAIFKPWLNKSEEAEYIPVELPGRGIRMMETPIAEMQELIDLIIPDLMEVATTPFVFFGHSLGAVIGFQLAWTLQERQLPIPDLLVVAGRHAPHKADPSTLKSGLNDQEMMDELKRLNGTPKEVLENKEMLKFLMPMIRGDLRLHESFVYSGQKLSIPMVAHCGTLDDEADMDIMSHWSLTTDKPFQIRQFDGDHFFVQTLGQRYFEALDCTITEIINQKHNKLSPDWT
ncbi:MAG: thioesterase domain-containing protein [Bacteroidota bacterium]